MNSRPRKNDSSRGKQRKLQSAKNCSILHRIPACLQSSSQANHTKSGPASLCTTHHPWQLVQAITMQSPEDQEALTGTRRVGTKEEATIQTAVGRVVAMGVALILNKDEDLLPHIPVVGWVERVVHVVGVAVAMELAGQIIHKAGHMVHLAQAEARTILKVVLTISSSTGTGNSMTIS